MSKFLYDQNAIRQQKLDRFRQSFLLLTQDGYYPPERQSRLYQATIQAGIDWDDARRFIRPDAEAFFQRHMTNLLAQGQLTPDAVAELNRLRRRLGIDATATAELTQRAPQPAPQASLQPARQPFSIRTILKYLVIMPILAALIWFMLFIATAIIGAILSFALPRELVGLVGGLFMLISMPIAIFISIAILRRKPSNSATQAQHHQSYQRPAPPRAASGGSYAPLPITGPPAQRRSLHAPAYSARDLALIVSQQTPTQFEHWVAERLTELGWQQVRVMGGRGDRGVDIRGTYQGKRCIVQCKHYPNKLIPPNEVRALIGTRNIQRAQRAYLVTSGRFGDQCFKEIHRKPIELWDLESLATHLNNQVVAAA